MSLFKNIFEKLLVILPIFVFPSILFGQQMFDLKGAIITVNLKDSIKYNIAVFLQQEIFKRTGNELAIKSLDEYCTAPQIRLIHNKYLNIDVSIQTPTLAESYTISASMGKDLVPVVSVTGYDNRGILFGAGRLVRELYLSENYISLRRSTNISSSPSSVLRAQQIILNSQGNDGFRNWKDRKINKDFVNEMLLFGTNGFEPTQPDLIDEYLQNLDVDLFVKLKCQDIIDLHAQSDQAIKGVFKQYVGVDHITTYGGDASGAVAPQLFFPFLDHVIPLVLAGHPGAKWWYSNQCLEDHAKDYDDYIFPFINKYQPSYLHGLVYGPWTKRGISEIRNRFVLAAADETADDQRWLESLLMIVVDKPAESWTDADMTSFEPKLSDLARRFINLEALQKGMVASKNKGFDARRITIAHPNGEEVHRLVWLDREDSDRLEPLVEKILNEAIVQGNDRLQQALIAKLAEKVLGERQLEGINPISTKVSSQKRSPKSS